MTRGRGLVSIGVIVALAFVVVLVGGYALPGKPKAAAVLEGQPSKIEDFDTLFRENCAGCHGDNGRGGAAFGLNNPIYLAIIDDEIVRRVIVDGVAGTTMPGFSHAAGGLLTDRQLDVLAGGMRKRWAPPEARSETPPPYHGPTGDPQRGASVFANSCASCHGNGAGNDKTGSIVDGSYLALVSNQMLRTLLIAGRPDIGQPDWRGDVPGRPLSSQQIADVVAWLAAHRVQFPGRPYPASR